ncbi:SGL domain-containing protein [Pseudozyma hubeiensis]|nr:SGL domain-containing protein [Pseudozyma hubeiensis]
MAPIAKGISAMLSLMSRRQQGNESFLKTLPAGYNASLISFIDRHELDAIQGSFNRSVWTSPWNDTLSAALSPLEYDQVLSTPFVAYDRRFLDIVGKQPSLKKLMDLDQRIHEAPAYVPDTNQLFFSAWGELAPDSFAQHNWQYWVDVGSLEDDASQIKWHNVTLDPPIQNAHGSFYYKGELYVCTDGGNGTAPSVHVVDVNNRTSKVLLNNYYGHRFAGFNDLAISPDGTMFISDTSTGFEHGLNPSPPGNPGYTWMFEPSTGEVRPVGNTLDKGNGVTVSPDGQHLVVADTGGAKASGRNPLGNRSITKYKIDYTEDGGHAITSSAILATPVAGLYDGLRYTGSGKYLVGGSYEGLDFLDSVTGSVLGSIRVPFPDSTVNFAFRKGGGIYVVGKGGMYSIKIAEEMAWGDPSFSSS